VGVGTYPPRLLEFYKSDFVPFESDDVDRRPLQYPPGLVTKKVLGDQLGGGPKKGNPQFLGGPLTPRPVATRLKLGPMADIFRCEDIALSQVVSEIFEVKVSNSPPNISKTARDTPKKFCVLRLTNM
jgi:hypothetical protein